MAAPEFTKVESVKYHIGAVRGALADTVPSESTGPGCIRRPAGGARVSRERGALASGGLAPRGENHRGLSRVQDPAEK